MESSQGVTPRGQGAHGPERKQTHPEGGARSYLPAGSVLILRRVMTCATAGMVHGTHPVHTVNAQARHTSLPTL